MRPPSVCLLLSVLLGVTVNHILILILVLIGWSLAQDHYLAARARAIAQIPNSYCQPLQNLSTLKVSRPKQNSTASCLSG